MKTLKCSFPYPECPKVLDPFNSDWRLTDILNTPEDKSHCVGTDLEYSGFSTKGILDNI